LLIEAGERKGYWTPKSIAGNGQIHLRKIVDAGTEDKDLWKPSPAPLIKLGAQKVSVDPIGRVRPAND
jgi:CRISPR-associated endonuclease Csn1